MTPRLFCEQDLRLVFTLPGSRSELRSALSEPRVVGQPRLVPVVPVKMHAVVSGPGEGATLELAGKISAPALLNVADEELLLLTPEVWEEFREVARSIEGSLSAVPRARWQLEEALAGRSLEAVAQAEKNLGMAEDRAAAMLNGNFARKTDLVEVITFESYSRKSDGQPQQEVGLRRNYLPRFKYDEFKGRRVMGVPTHVDVGMSTRAGDSAMSVVADDDQGADRPKREGAEHPVRPYRAGWEPVLRAGARVGDLLGGDLRAVAAVCGGCRGQCPGGVGSPAPQGQRQGRCGCTLQTGAV
ncbi:hypothetical protein G6F65_016011 [Rhizopus arrhizus]|nr:hypothetical protein G6F65_016011 [Rhizopus arrhizus]